MEEQNTQTPRPTPSPSTNPKDIEDNKIIALIGYIGILCLIPLLLKKDSPYAQFHGKQSLVLLIVWIVIGVIGIVPVLGWIVAFFGNIVCIILMIVGMVNAWQGQMKELPIIGEYAKKVNL
ncbi:MAG: DUF4870 domain-containing protein [Candidatus Magasanikbacteria bacterium]